MNRAQAEGILEALDEFLESPGVKAHTLKVRKADDFWRRLHLIADKAEPRLRMEILRSIAETASGINMEHLERALSHGDFDLAARQIPWKELGEKSLRAAYRTILEDVYVQAGNLTANDLGQKLDAAISFDRTNPRAARWADEVAGTRVREVSENTVDGIRASIRRGFDEGLHPRETARLMRGPKGEDGLYRQSLIGLTEHQAEAVWNYREALRNNDIERDQDTEERMVERYRDKLVLNRAETIARTETIRASTEGQQELWRQAQANGQLRGDEQREWIATPDQRLCPSCEALDGMRVGLDEEFEDPEGEFDDVLVPPLHVSCRCAMGIVLPDDQEQED